MKPIRGSLGTFFPFFQKLLDSINSLPFSPHVNNYKKILYYSVIDALANVVYPKMAPRTRVVSLIKHYAGWDHGNTKVSLPHLVCFLEKIDDKAFSRLQDFAFSLYNDWDSISPNGLEDDPDYLQIKALWPKEEKYRKPLKGSGITLDYLLHVNLFYTYRNSLVHEIRQLGYGIESDQTKPDYIITVYFVDCADGRSVVEAYEWELIYPTRFFEGLCANLLITVRDYCAKCGIDPYSRFRFGSYWLKELNE